MLGSVLYPVLSPDKPDYHTTALEFLKRVVCE
jgi:hypothetical protein